MSEATPEKDEGLAEGTLLSHLAELRNRLFKVLAKGAGLEAGQLIGQLGDCHLYNNHLDQAKEYRRRAKRALPFLHLDKGLSANILGTKPPEGRKLHMDFPTTQEGWPANRVRSCRPWRVRQIPSEAW